MFIGGCDKQAKPPAINLQGSTMGTSYNITLVSAPVDFPLQTLTRNIAAKLAHVEDLTSTYRDESELSKFNTADSTDWIRVSSELCTIVSRALAIARQTMGAFDITVGPLVNLWGFGPVDRKNNVPTASEIDEAMRHVGHPSLQTDCERPAIRKMSAKMFVDLSGWAKGYAVDEIAELLDDVALDNYLIEIGGEIRVKGKNAKSRPFAIGLEDPVPGQVRISTKVHISNAAVATSGDYRNFFERGGQNFSHTIDPRTGRPIDHNLASVTVVSNSTAYADAMATALLVMGRNDGLALANRSHIAAYFVSRTNGGFAYDASIAFAPLIVE